ncbi:copine-8 [Lepeophtheirus salmonis]|uniref:Copine-3 n=1 Tax=Lepeophtheirus salmonis TaxID=72036 RepID=A0A0K2UXN5_LEPSM|nr:copine-8-like [Lepeophtheirus salmonis]XP_040568300.1 copine-8-like [Lepeophtheirus salmonis]XP_040568301.1 copine-8-like [Lepeophtheirus salmonis]XP_040568302.1 copine-8-like [Lepeophtheirus salmonis]XP_040568303.1 copine-8-like [Lepeophtheirus salmonis]XP_040568305.1 copine-8-like [Lepeophtheirus salmonis]
MFGNPSANFQVGSSATPKSTVELTLSAENLADMDVFDKSDPFCVVYLKEFNGSNTWLEMGRTEHINNNLNPSWVKKIVLEYRFEERQMLRFDVYDYDIKGSSNLDNHDFLGTCSCSLGEIVTGGSMGAVCSIPLQKKKNGSKLLISVEEMQVNKEETVWKVYAKNCDKKDFFGKSDPFLLISKSTPEGNGKYIPVHKTEVVKNTLNPIWKQFTIPIASLCNGDYLRPLMFEVSDWNRNGTEDFIGSVNLTLREIRDKGSFSVDLINDSKRKKKGSKYSNSGVLYFEKVFFNPIFSFLDYIQNGMQLNFTVAIDFTASNGNPDHPNSLHYRDNPNNQYVMAIKSVGDIIQDYDSDKIFPALGFGARIPPMGNISHEFYLNLREDNPHCVGVEGILQAYYTSLNSVQLYGPTNFSPVINHVAKFAYAYESDPLNYFVLLIITDGIITDMRNTKKAIVSASGLPMSIIIVGVGSEDFSDMSELDSDEELLSIDGQKAKRDIVQFVELQKYMKGSTGAWSKEYLAKDVLAEIPSQITGYMKTKGVKPTDLKIPSSYRAAK